MGDELTKKDSRPENLAVSEDAIIDEAVPIDLRKKNRGEAKVHYNLIKYKKKGLYKILEDISEHFTLVQLMDSLGNVNNDISVVGYWIFDSNYEKALVLNRASLDMMCAPSVGEEQASKL